MCVCEKIERTTGKVYIKKQSSAAYAAHSEDRLVRSSTFHYSQMKFL